jgi:hypothetical protein
VTLGSAPRAIPESVAQHRRALQNNAFCSGRPRSAAAESAASGGADTQWRRSYRFVTYPPDTLVKVELTKDDRVSEAPDGIITSATLRTAIRAKISAGISRRAISLLIHGYAPPEAQGRDEDSVRRLAVEVIPHERRVAFLDALARLQDDLPITPITTARLAG